MRSSDKKELVAQGYDQIADEYLKRFGHSSARARQLDELMARMPAAGSILDLGSGAGVPVARDLTERGFNVTGVDASGRQVERARANVPNATFILADMATLRFAPETFDAVIALYSLSHLPKEEHAALIQSIATWLRPNGRFLANFGVQEGDWTGLWLGTTMFFSHHDPMTAENIVRASGFDIDESEIRKQDNEEASFLWLMAHKR